MTKVVLSNKFKRAVRKFTRRDAQLQAKIEATIAQISEDLANPALGTHKLEVNCLVYWLALVVMIAGLSSRSRLKKIARKQLSFC